MGATQMASSCKGAKSQTHGRKNRSSDTKAITPVSNEPNSLVELKKQLETRTRGASRRGAGAADRDLGGAASHLELTGRLAVRVPGHA